jgi:hypothetical protein
VEPGCGVLVDHEEAPLVGRDVTNRLGRRIGGSLCSIRTEAAGVSV